MHVIVDYLFMQIKQPPMNDFIWFDVDFLVYLGKMT